MPEPIPQRFKDRFWARVEFGDGCWEWIGSKKKTGYGSFREPGGRTVGVHRFAYELQIGPIPDGLSVLHYCDNPGCVRGDHLFAGTQADNIKDCRDKGRLANNLEPRTLKELCKHGHPGPWRWKKTGGRECMECQRRINREYRQRKLADQRKSQ